MTATAGSGQPEVLLFDLGGVLIEFAGFERMNALLAEPLSDREMRARWLASEAVREFELGKLAPSEFAERVVAEWDLPVAPGEFLRWFASWFRGFYSGVPALLRELRTRHRVACLSNSNRLHWEAAGDGVAPHFDAVFLSFELGLVKPDPAIFRAVIRNLGVSPGRVLFFDDSEPNVEAAGDLGFQVALVSGPDGVRARLAERGLLARRCYD